MGKWPPQPTVLRAPGPRCFRAAGSGGGSIPLHLGSESVSDLPAHRAAEAPGGARFQPAGQYASGPALKPLRHAPIFQSANLPFLGLSEDIDGLEVVGRGQPFTSVKVEDDSVFDRSQESSSEDTVSL